MDPESVPPARYSPDPRTIPAAGRSFFFSMNPRVKLRSAARGRTKALHARITSAEAKNIRF